MTKALKTDNPIFIAADAFRQAWIDLGVTVGDIYRSTNRYGQKSAYFDVTGHGRFRVSDHSANEDFRSVRERTVHYTHATVETAAHYLRIDAEATAKWEAENAERIANEAAANAAKAARIADEQELAGRRREFWDAELSGFEYGGSRANAIKALKKAGVVCPF